MKQLLIILLLSFTTLIYAQTDSTRVDTLENYYVTHTDSPDSLRTEMTWEEMEELWDEQENRKTNREQVDEVLYNSQSVQQNINQNKQDYTNFYYRKKRTTLIGLLLP